MADRICDNCMSRVPQGGERCPRCGIHFENTNPGGALPNGWVLDGRYTVGRYVEIDGEGVTYSAIDAQTMRRVSVKEFMPVTLCAAREADGVIRPKPGCEVLFKTTRMDYTDLYGSIMALGPAEGLLQVLDVLEENNTSYAVMEKVEGPTLAEYLTKKEGPVEAARALTMMRPVLDGVEVMHSANLIHRGISPENIVLESGGAARLGGYGTLALRQQGSELKAKLYAGYSAPEQYAASEFEGRYTDIYALGAVLYHLCTGVVPEPADERKLQDTQKPARALNKDVPTFLSAGIARAARILPAERLQTLPELRLALTGEGPRSAKEGPFGLSRQQMIIGVAAVSAVVALLLIILLVSAFTRNTNRPASSSSSLSSSVSVSSAPVVTVPKLAGLNVADVIGNAAYSEFVFDTPEERYDPQVKAGLIISQDPAEGAAWDGSTPIKLVVSLGAEPVVLAEYAGQTKDAVTRALNELGIAYVLKVEANNGGYEKDIVIRTDPVAGTAVVPGTGTVTVYVAGEVALTPMPNLVGQTQANAEAEMTRLGVQYQVQVIDNQVGAQYNGLVEGTDPVATSSIATGSTVVNLRVYGNYRMPDLSVYINQHYSVLTTFLAAHGIPYNQPVEMDNPGGQPAGNVHSLLYTVGVEVNSGTPVTIYIYKTYTPPPAPPTNPTTSTAGAAVGGVPPAVAAPGKRD